MISMFLLYDFPLLSFVVYFPFIAIYFYFDRFLENVLFEIQFLLSYHYFILLFSFDFNFIDDVKQDETHDKFTPQNIPSASGMHAFTP